MMRTFLELINQLCHVKVTSNPSSPKSPRIEFVSANQNFMNSMNTPGDGSENIPDAAPTAGRTSNVPVSSRNATTAKSAER